jgi:hypothetical protein
VRAATRGMKPYYWNGDNLLDPLLSKTHVGFMDGCMLTFNPQTSWHNALLPLRCFGEDWQRLNMKPPSQHLSDFRNIKIEDIGLLLVISMTNSIFVNSIFVRRI